MGAFRLPKESEEEQTKRNAAIHLATLNAARVPLRVAKNAVKVMDLALKCAKEANINAISDSMSGFAMARAALTAAGYNVKINLNSLADKRSSPGDKSAGEKMLEELKEIGSKAEELEKEIRKTMSERGGI
jgi:formiminotetrahydrofolate cyclodeaminase